MMKKTWLTSAVFVSGFGLLSACNSGTPATPAAPTTQVNGARPSWATAGNLAGNLGANERVDIQVHLAMRNEKDAEAELAEIGDPTALASASTSRMRSTTRSTPRRPRMSPPWSRTSSSTA